MLAFITFYRSRNLPTFRNWRRTESIWATRPIRQILHKSKPDECQALRCVRAVAGIIQEHGGSDCLRPDNPRGRGDGGPVTDRVSVRRSPIRAHGA